MVDYREPPSRQASRGFRMKSAPPRGHPAGICLARHWSYGDETWLALSLAGASRHYDGGDGANQNRSIEAQRPVIDVIQIQLHPLLERKVAASGDLPQTGQPRLYAKAPL